jgi:hypothetical protein
MQHKYKGSYYKGSNVGSRQFKQQGSSKPIVKSKNKGWTGTILICIAIALLLSFFHFNRKESKQQQRDNIEDTVELIQRVAKYNLETDLAENQSTETAKKASINYYNPAQIRQIQMEKHKAIALENKRRTDYMATQMALDYGENNNNKMTNSHDQYHLPPQPASDSTCQAILPIDKSRRHQTQTMHEAHFNPNAHMKNLNHMYEQKPYQKINSPFVHPEETTRPLGPEPKEYNNTLETDNRTDMFLQNIPSNVFENGFFNVSESYESPFLANANMVTKYGVPCVDKSNINKTNDTVMGYTHTGFSEFM